MDVGFFFAHLDRDVLCRRLSAKDAETCKHIFLEGYGQIMHPPTVSRLETYQAAGLIRLAVEPFCNREPSWFDKMGRMLARAGEICAEENLPVYGNQANSDKTALQTVGEAHAVIEDKLLWSSNTRETVQDNLRIRCAHA